MNIRLFTGRQYQDLKKNIQDPFEMLNRLMLPGHHALVAVEQNGDEDLYLGILIFVRVRDAMMVEWIWVEPVVRDRGIGEELIRAAFTVAHGFGLSKLHAYIPRLYGRESVCPRDVSFAKRYFGEDEREVPGEWSRSLKNLTVSLKSLKRTFEEDKERLKNVVIEPLRQEAGRMNAILQSLEETKAVESLYPLSDKRELIETRISMVVASGDAGKGGSGCAIWQEAGEKDLFLSGFGATDHGLFRKLFLASLLQIMKDYTADTTIHVQLWTEDYADIMRETFGENGGALFLTGDVESFLQRGPEPSYRDADELLLENPTDFLNRYLTEPERENELTSIEEAMKRHEMKTKKRSAVKSLRGLTLSELGEGLDVLLQKDREESPKWFRSIPVAYYDLTTSLCSVDKEDRITGICLTHYEEDEEKLYVVGTIEEKDELLPISLAMAKEKYSSKLSVVLPV